jgi:predicted ATP-dependent endonuclease of OLD family
MFSGRSNKGSVEGKGHGMQRAVIFSILRAYAKLVTTRADKAKRTLILGVEEPELYMHPTAQRTIRRVFRDIADGGDQVLFSTHSPLMVDVTYFDEIIRMQATEPTDKGIAISACPKPHQLPVQTLIDNLVAHHKDLEGKISPQSMRERYSHAYTASRNEGFFAKRVILVEGQTEVYALPIYAGAMGKDLDALGVAVVECGGKQQMDRLYRVFNELGIVCYPVFDYDKGNNKSGVRKASDELLALFNRPDIIDPTTAQVTDSFACFSVKWETDLKPEIAEYEKLVAEAKEFFGLDDTGKPLVARYIAVKLTQETLPVVPPTIKTIIEKALAAKHAGTCLKKSVITGSKPASALATA